MPNALKYGFLFAFLGLLLAVSAGLSPVWYDDAGHYIVVRELARQGTPCYPVDLAAGQCDARSPFITMGPALNYPLAGWIHLTGGGMMAARFAVAFMSLLALLAFGWLGRGVHHRNGKVWWAIALVVGNIQLVTYGAEVLGEVPMLGWVFLGLGAHLRWIKTRHWAWAGVAVVAWMLAILTKEYIGLVIAPGLLAWWMVVLLRREWKALLGLSLQGVALLGLVGAYHLLRAGGLAEVATWFQERQSYGSEFLAFGLGEGMRFLLLKPLVILGTAALVVKVRVRREPRDIFLLCFQGAWLAFFLSSAGFDRFGFQLIFIPALYLAEFMETAWARWVRKKFMRMAVFCLLFVVLFWQRTLPAFAERVWQGGRPNAGEECIVAALTTHRVEAIFTYDQQLVPFLSEDFPVRLSPVVPSNAEACQPLVLREGEWLIAGPYAFTEFQNCIAWAQLEEVTACGEGMQHYVLYRQRFPMRSD